MRVSLGMSCVALALVAKEQLSLPVNCFNFAGAQMPPPNTKNDNAAKRQRAAKKRRKAKGRR
jgi:hypothetical protein